MYQLVRQKRKTMSIGIDENLQIIVKAPYHLPIHIVEEFVQKHTEWIEQAIVTKKKALDLQNWWQKKQLFYLGEERKIILQRGRNEGISVVSTGLIVTRETICDEVNVQKYIEKWLTEKVRVLVTELSDKYCKLLGCDYNKIYIRKQRTRWGSCSAKGNLSFNSRLICAPIGCIEYVVLHEIMHLIHFNHSKQFWDAIEAVMPEYKRYQNILKMQGENYNF